MYISLDLGAAHPYLRVRSFTDGEGHFLYSHPQHRASQNVRRLRQEAGEWLRALREHKRLSQRQLAARVGLDYYTFVSQLEAGRGRIPPDRYEAWAEALGVDAQSFVRELMRYYDPVTFGLLFPDAGHRSDPDASPPPRPRQ